MLAGKVIAGLKVVKQFFPEAVLGTEKPSPAVLNALSDLQEVENASARDVVRIFDSHSIGVWGGVQIK